MNKKSIIFATLLFLLGCGSSNNSNHSANIDPIFKKINTGFPTGGMKFLKNDKNVTWVDGIDLILDKNIEIKLFDKKIYKYNPYGFYNLHKYLKNAKFLIYWLPNNWDESWFNIKKIQLAMNKGYIPVFNYWYFGDRAINFSDDEINKYYKNVKKVASFLAKLKGKKIIIFEPEFNKNYLLNDEDKYKKFISIISKAIDIIKNKNPDILVSLCMMDTGNRGENQTYKKCGFSNCALGDKYEWGKVDKIYKPLLSKLDFISFQEVVGQFSRNPKNPDNPISYTDKEIGIKYLPDRIENLTTFLHQKYKKPIFLDYVGIASGVWNDKNGNEKIDSDEIDKNGWNKYINTTYKELREKRKTLFESGLFGYAPMVLIDDPSHDKGGYQFFLQNEYHLGIIKTSAKDEDTAPYGDLMPKGINLLDYIYAPSKEIYEKNVKLNEEKCEKEKRPYCEKISKIKLNTYYDMTIEKIQKEKEGKAILIPLYSYPDLDEDNSSWQKIIDLKKKYLNKRIVAIVNPENGDFNSSNEDFVNGIRELSKAGVEVIGYIYTSYGNRDKNEILKDIDNWNNLYKLYGIRGIFFDEVSTDENQLKYYTNIINYAKSKGFYFNILNPGTYTNQIYIDSEISDIVVDYENNYSYFENDLPTLNAPSYITSLGFLIHSMDGNKTNELYKFSKDNNLTYFYFTEDNDSNPYDSVSKYLEDEIKLIH